MNEKEKALAKIQKCLRLAKSTNSHEAALALKQAYALMKKHNISESVALDCDNFVKGGEVKSHNTAQVPSYINSLLNVIMRCFTVSVVFRTGYDNNTTVIFYGNQSDVMIAEYAYMFLARKLTKARSEYISSLGCIRKSSKTKRGDAFARGWIFAVYEELKTLQRYNDDAAYKAAHAKVRAYQKSLTGEIEVAKTKESSTSPHHVDAVCLGIKSGSKVSISRAVNATEQVYLEDKTA